MYVKRAIRKIPDTNKSLNERTMASNLLSEGCLTTSFYVQK
jgi:hypothetical protein